MVDTNFQYHDPGYAAETADAIVSPCFFRAMCQATIDASFRLLLNQRKQSTALS